MMIVHLGVSDAVWCKVISIGVTIGQVTVAHRSRAVSEFYTSDQQIKEKNKYSMNRYRTKALRK